MNRTKAPEHPKDNYQLVHTDHVQKYVRLVPDAARLSVTGICSFCPDASYTTKRESQYDECSGSCTTHHVWVDNATFVDIVAKVRMV